MTVIKFNKVRKSLGDKEVIKDLTFEVKKSEIFVIIGQSGTGKSVTLKLITGLLKPDSGSIIINNEDITHANNEKLLEVRKIFGFLFQSGALLNSLSLFDNVALPLREHENLTEKELARVVKEKLSLVNMSDSMDKFPQELSGGMKKRAGLARAIVRTPQVILYDEPTSGLDPVIATTINNLIVNTNKKINATSIVVTHDMQSAYSIADRIAMLNNGKIVQIGTPNEIKNSQNPVVKQFINGKIDGPINLE